MALVAHLHGAPHDRHELDAAGGPHGPADHRAEHRVDVLEPLVHAGVVAAVVEAAALLALVEVAERGVAERRVLDHEHRHRRRVDAGQRADAAVAVRRRRRTISPDSSRAIASSRVGARPSNWAAPMIASRWPPVYSANGSGAPDVRIRFGA